MTFRPHPALRPVRGALLSSLLVLCSLGALAQGLRLTPQLAPRPSLSTASAVQRAADFIVAIVNTEPVTNNEVRSRLVRLEQQLVQQGAAVPPRSELLGQVLERIINERAQLQFARESGLRVDDAQVDAALEQVAQSNQLNMDQLRRRVEADGVGWVRFRADMRDELTLTRVREREVESRLRVTDQEVDQFIRDQQVTDAASASDVEANLAQILVTVPEKANETQLRGLRQRAERALARVRAGEDFFAMAREYSDDTQRENGGQMGMRPLDRYPQLFVDATRDLKTGAVTEILRSEAGFHILKVVEKRRAGGLAVNVSQTRARHILLRPSAQLSESAAKARLAELRRRIAAGGDFAVFAREISQDGSAPQGGDLGWANPGQFVPEFEEVMNSLAPGQISEPFTSRFGVHLVQVQERRQTSVGQREQRDIARRLLREQRSDEVYTRWAQDVRARAYVEMREPAQ